MGCDLKIKPSPRRPGHARPQQPYIAVHNVTLIMSVFKELTKLWTHTWCRKHFGVYVSTVYLIYFLSVCFNYFLVAIGICKEEFYCFAAQFSSKAIILNVIAIVCQINYQNTGLFNSQG